MSMLRYAAILAFVLFIVKVRGQACEDADWCDTIEDACLGQSVAQYCPKKCKLCLSDRCGSCEQNCTMLDGGPEYKCTCNKGFRLNKDLKTCSDINECEQNPLICGTRKFCENKEGGYECVADQCIPFQHRNYIRSYSHPDKCCKMTRGECGQNNQNLNQESKRIFGGQNASAGMWPWQAMIIRQGELCGGSLIHRRWVVANARCFSSVRSRRRVNINVYFGVLNRKQLNDQAVQSRKIIEVIKHERFRFPVNDIALAKLDRPILTSTFVRPVCLPNGEIPADGTRCFTTGFGITDPFDGNPATFLHQVDLPIVNGATCQKAYEKSKYTVDPKKMICAGHKDGGKDACLGDSGGPLVCQRCDSCDWYLAGITSFGQGCASPEFPGVFTRVESYEKWIDSKIGAIKVIKKVCKPTQWTNWGAWIKCTRSCNGGSQTRVRICLNGRSGLPGCLGHGFEKISCNTQACGVGPWSDWTSCSKSCGGGEQTRTTRCTLPNCEKLKESQSCNNQKCPEWRLWSPWSPCSKSCNEGKRSRTRSCDNVEGGTCVGQDKQSEICNRQKCPEWRQWSPWSPCSNTCGEGTRNRRRSCDNAEGGVCVGMDKQSEICNKDANCAKWSPWTPWEACSAECGGGEQSSFRDCIGGDAGIGCVGSNKRSRTCNSKECPGRFSAWSDWGKCSTSCGEGTQERQRFCPKASCRPDDFGSSVRDTQSCNIINCRGEWSLWSQWGQCSRSCGVGKQGRTRSCTEGLECAGNSNEESDCNTHECVGTWSDWSLWSPCDVTCGESSRFRERLCENGVNCPGDKTEIVGCQTLPCPVWSSWLEWSPCDVSCGEGTRMRRRICENGGNCVGEAGELENCSAKICPTWSTWTDWSSCDATCGQGARMRKRSCQNGENCSGAANHSETCMIKPCPTWSDWTAWSECSKSCAIGQRSRTRVCGKEIGDQCEGKDSETENCAEEPCPSQCDERCKSQVLAGWCLTQSQWMERTCHGDCCSKEHCRDSLEGCGDYDLRYCFDDTFRVRCIATCGYCP